MTEQEIREEAMRQQSKTANVTITMEAVPSVTARELDEALWAALEPFVQKDSEEDSPYYSSIISGVR